MSSLFEVLKTLTEMAELIRQGIESALIAPPMRYTHSPFETVHEDDLRKMVQLLKAFLESKL